MFTSTRRRAEEKEEQEQEQEEQEQGALMCDKKRARHFRGEEPQSKI